MNIVLIVNYFMQSLDLLDSLSPCYKFIFDKEFGSLRGVWLEEEYYGAKRLVGAPSL